MICTHGIRRRAKAAMLRAFAKIQVLFLLVWDRFWPTPPCATSTVADGICLVQSGGGPFVYLSMGWNDRAKLLERAQLYKAGEPDEEQQEKLEWKSRSEDSE